MEQTGERIMKNNLSRNPLFSIIIPVYNNEQFIGECIECLLGQSFSDFELLLIDDGSTDSSGDICDEYAEKDIRIRVFHGHNQGVSAARNRGLKEARGIYINFVDSDDWVTEDYLEAYVKARSDYDYDLVYTEMIREKNGKVIYTPLRVMSIKPGEDLSEGLAYLLTCAEFGFACNKSFKREIQTLYSITFNEQLPLYEDCLFTAIYCMYANSLMIYPHGIYHYRVNESSFRLMDYSIYHMATIHGVKVLDHLVDRFGSDIFKNAAGLFCQKWEQMAVLYMYLHGENISKRERLSYLKDFKHRFDTLEPYIKRSGIINRFVSFGMTLKNNRLLDIFFCIVRMVYKLKNAV